jgi:starch phosphorylase
MMGRKQPRVAYFCMEYALDNSFRTYAGGLGILAGDYLKGAKDHDFPVIGIGIKWKQGYTDQKIGSDNKPFDTYHNYQYDFLKETGIKVTVKIRQRNVVCKVWKVDCFGNAPLYLLDTDLPENEDAWITGQLYGWFGEERIAQEMVLGIGGIKALRALGLETDVYHFNEGHALFAGLELIREKMTRGFSFNDALKASAREIVFTTHTPIIQGNESHYMERLFYMGANNGLTWDQMVAIGGNPFNMTVAALRLSRIANAVSKLHSYTAQKMWQSVTERSEIIGITNAIHAPTWVDTAMLKAVSGEGDLWEGHQKNKRNLVEFVKERTGAELRVDKLLIGFSRRAVPYKRNSLIFSEPDRIFPLLREQKMQIVFSGKAHPLDDHGKEMVSNLVRISKQFPNAVVFLENYDMTIGKMLTRGSDIWLNNPRRPLEASGTSGMKAAMNGVLNCSTLDGWWPEACQHGVNGWQIGDGFESWDERAQDAHDLKALYRVLENEILPIYYNNRSQWIQMMKNSILSTQENFSMKRMLEEYYGKMYLVRE